MTLIHANFRSELQTFFQLCDFIPHWRSPPQPLNMSLASFLILSHCLSFMLRSFRKVAKFATPILCVIVEILMISPEFKSQVKYLYQILKKLESRKWNKWIYWVIRIHWEQRKVTKGDLITFELPPNPQLSSNPEPKLPQSLRTLTRIQTLSATHLVQAWIKRARHSKGTGRYPSNLENLV